MTGDGGWAARGRVMRDGLEGWVGGADHGEL